MHQAFKVYEDESLEDLQLKGLYLIQKKDAFRFGMDAVLLSGFAAVKPGKRVVDLGTGTGILPILLSAKTKAEKIFGVEIQDEMVEIAKRNVAGNSLEDRIEIISGDIRSLKLIPGSFDVVVTNPPYTKVKGGLTNPEEKKAIARHEILCTLEDVLKTASALLNYHGEFYMVHRPDRLADITVGMRAFNLEPKLLRLVCPRVGDAPSLILIKGLKQGNPGMKIMPTLVIYNEDGTYTPEACIQYGNISIDP